MSNRVYMPTFKDQDGNVLVIANDDMTFDNSVQCLNFMDDNECKEICRILKLEAKGYTSVKKGEKISGVTKQHAMIPGHVLVAICISGPHFDENKPVDVQLIEVDERPEVGSWLEVWIEPNSNIAACCNFKRDSDGTCYILEVGGRRKINIDAWVKDRQIKVRKIFVSSNPPEHKDGACSCGNPKCNKDASADIAAFGKELLDMITGM